VELEPTWRFPQAALVGASVNVDEPPEPVRGSRVGELGAFVGMLMFPLDAPEVVGQYLTTAVQL
jgi:hypothetical protein